MVTHPIPPLFSSSSRILILGSFPSIKSREEGFFYTHRMNRFWKVISTILNRDTPETIEEKKDLILSSNLALWDVIASCEITGSSDSSIRSVEANDLRSVLDNSKIEVIFTNGRKAYELYGRYIEPVIGRKAVLLPSTSPANAATSLSDLIDIWGCEIRKYL
ncbi:MAG: DNA-deoxyinosine glycosylase [Spirochaetales bacterium]|nr:DNA-deoxyinosine glycosylase [Spirochaetales bacterium]